MTIHRLSAPFTGAISIPDRFPALLEHDFATQGLGHWGAPLVGHQRDIVDGAYQASAWGNDDNHLTTKGGPGRVHLMTFADHHYFRHTTPAGVLVGSDLTNAIVEMEVRGIDGFQLASNQSFIVWVTGDHPDFPPYPAEGYKIANWGFVGEPRQITSDWTVVSWRLDPEGQWVFGAGVGIYSEFLSLRETLQNTHNLHVLALGPDNAVAPSGAFQMRKPRIIFNRNGPALQGPMWDVDAKASAVTLSNGNLLASHGPFTSVGGVRGTTKLTGKRYWEAKHVSGDITKSFSFGICNASYLPSVNGGTFYADTANGWGYLTEQAEKRHGQTDVAWGSAFSSGDTYMVAFDKDAGKVWFGKNGTWFNSGDPETGANPAYDSLTGDMYPIESNGTGNGSWVWRANFGGEAFAFTPPVGFSGL